MSGFEFLRGFSILHNWARLAPIRVVKLAIEFGITVLVIMVGWVRLL